MDNCEQYPVLSATHCTLETDHLSLHKITSHHGHVKNLIHKWLITVKSYKGLVIQLSLYLKLKYPEQKRFRNIKSKCEEYSLDLKLFYKLKSFINTNIVISIWSFANISSCFDMSSLNCRQCSGYLHMN